MQVRPAKTGDANRICHVLRRSIAELCVQDHEGRDDILLPWLSNKTPDNVRHWIRSPDQYTVVAEIDGHIAGVGQVSGEGKVLLNYVSPDYRFQGVSKAVMLVMEDHLRKQGFTLAQLVSTGTARKFYESIGYRLAGEPQPWRAGQVAYPMEKQLIG